MTKQISCADAIDRNRKREARRNKAERTIRRIRQRIFDYEDIGPAMLAKAQRIMERCKVILRPRWQAEHHRQQKRATDRMMRSYE